MLGMVCVQLGMTPDDPWKRDQGEEMLLITTRADNHPYNSTAHITNINLIGAAYVDGANLESPEGGKIPVLEPPQLNHSFIAQETRNKMYRNKFT